MSELCLYEKQRLAHIRRNHEFLCSSYRCSLFKTFRAWQVGPWRASGTPQNTKNDCKRLRFRHAGLGLASADVDPVEAMMTGGKPKNKNAAPRPKKVKVPVPPESLRRSARLVGATPDFTHETIDALGDDDAKAAQLAQR